MSDPNTIFTVRMPSLFLVILSFLSAHFQY